MSYQILFNENSEGVFESFVNFPQINNYDIIDAFEHCLILSHKLTIFEKISQRKFQCSDCKFIKKHLTIGGCTSYNCQKREYVISLYTTSCPNFQMNGELKTKIELMDRNINPETFIDPHPRHKLKNGMEIIL